MKKNEDIYSVEKAAVDYRACCIATKSRASLMAPKFHQNLTHPMKSGEKYRLHDRECNLSSSSGSKQSEGKRYTKKLHVFDASEENVENLMIKDVPEKLEKCFADPEIIIHDCWKAAGNDPSVKIAKLFKEGSAEDPPDSPFKKRKPEVEEEKDVSPPYTKEFHLLTEVQKARILTAIEDTIKSVANEENFFSGSQSQPEKVFPAVSNNPSFERFFCKKFLLPWIVIKVIEMILCHIIQLIFLSEDSYFQRKKEFLPVAVTYYITLFVIVVSLIVHIGCFSYIGAQNPCYFMGVISSSILTLTTSLGIFIMLISMSYHKNLLEISVLVFIGVLLCSLFVELCLCYFEVKNIWQRVGQTDQYYIA